MLYFYNQLPAAEELEDAHTRIRIVNALERRVEPATVAAFVNELKRTPSNNVTRKLYTEILKKLRRFPAELTTEPIEKLLAEKKFGLRKELKNCLSRKTRAFGSSNQRCLSNCDSDQ